MKVYLVKYTRYNSWGEIKDCSVQEAFSNRQLANSFVNAWALSYARGDYHVVLFNSGVYVDTMQAEKSNSKIMEEEIIEIRVIEMEVK